MHHRGDLEDWTHKGSVIFCQGQGVDVSCLTKTLWRCWTLRSWSWARRRCGDPSVASKHSSSSLAVCCYFAAPTASSASILSMPVFSHWLLQPYLDRPSPGLTYLRSDPFHHFLTFIPKHSTPRDTRHGTSTWPESVSVPLIWASAPSFQGHPSPWYCTQHCN